MARPKASAEQRELQRERLRRAAADIYNEDGLRAVTVRSVCKRAGVSTGTLYSYYANLEALLQSFWIEAVERANHQLFAIVAEHPDAIPRVKALLQAYADFSYDEPQVFRGAVLFVRPASEPAPEPDPVENLPLYQLLRDAVLQGQSDGVVRMDDPDTMTQVLWAGIHGALALPVHLDRFQIKPASELTPPMIEALVAAIVVR